MMPGEGPSDAGLIAGGAEEGDALIWPIMLVVSVLGVVLIGMGAGAFFGSQINLAAFDVDGEDCGPTASEDYSGAVGRLDLPFWVCGDCHIVEPGVSATERCMKCGLIISFVAVEKNSEREIALSVFNT